ncbi:MAG: hypothetical protein QXK37_02300 [Candidatus Woesearchaeota archaeon]
MRFLFIISIMLIFTLGCTYTGMPSGFVTQNKQDNIIGNYTFSPHFTVKTTPSFDTYKQLRIDARKLIEQAITCEKNSNLDACVRKSLSELGLEKKGWSISCGFDKQIFFQNFVSFYKSCKESEDKDCVCKYNLKDKAYAADAKYEIVIRTDGVNTFFDLEGTTGAVVDGVLHTTSYLGMENTVPMKDASSIKAEYKDSNLVSAVLNIGRASSQIDTFSLYKKGEDVILSIPSSWSYFPIRECNLKPDRTYTFCVKSDEKVIAAEPGGSAELRPIIYNFALYFRDISPPPPIQSEILQAQKQEKALLVKFKPSIHDDIQYYKILYSEEDFSFIPKKEIEAKQEIKQVKLPTPLIFQGSIDLTCKQYTCMKDDYDCYKKKHTCLVKVYAPDGNIYTELRLKKGTLYKFEDKKESFYLYLLPVEKDHVNYFVSVIAVDEDNNEIDNVEQKYFISQGSSVDTLAPEILHSTTAYLVENNKKTLISWTTAQKNIDDTELQDLAGYKIYYSSNDFVSVDGLENIQVQTSLCKQCQNPPCDCSYVSQLPSETKYVAVVPYDHFGNEVKDVDNFPLR